MFKKRAEKEPRRSLIRHRSLVGARVRLPVRTAEVDDPKPEDVLPYRLRRVNAPLKRAEWIDVHDATLGYAGADRSWLYFEYPAGLPDAQLVALPQAAARELPIPEAVTKVAADVRAGECEPLAADPEQVAWNFLSTVTFPVGWLSDHAFTEPGRSGDGDPPHGGYAQLVGKVWVESMFGSEAKFEPALAYYRNEDALRGNRPAYALVHPGNLDSALAERFWRARLLPFFEAYLADPAAPTLLMPQAVPAVASAPSCRAEDLEGELYSECGLGEVHSSREQADLSRRHHLERAVEDLDQALARVTSLAHLVTLNPGYQDTVTGAPHEALPSYSHLLSDCDRHLQAIHTAAITAAHHFDWAGSTEGLERVAELYAALAQQLTGESEGCQAAKKSFAATSLFLRKRAAELPRPELWRELQRKTGVTDEQINAAWADLRRPYLALVPEQAGDAFVVAQSQQNGPKRGESVKLLSGQLVPVGRAVRERGPVLICEVEYGSRAPLCGAGEQPEDASGLRVDVPPEAFFTYLANHYREADLHQYLADPLAPDWLLDDGTA